MHPEKLLDSYLQCKAGFEAACTAVEGGEGVPQADFVLYVVAQVSGEDGERGWWIFGGGLWGVAWRWLFVAGLGRGFGMQDCTADVCEGF